MVLDPVMLLSSPRPAVDLDEETEITLEYEPVYSIESKTSAIGWESIRNQMLATVTESVRMPAGQICLLCMNNHALIRWQQCGSKSCYCQTCMESLQSQFSFLCAAEQWTVHLSLEMAKKFLFPPHPLPSIFP